ncbi:heme oxygenase (biliverdin-producing) [Rarobacter incanus]|uniref:Heme oxygenase n=1 Tax=Rarobacter incanus TaxID=153494 RepID=A0A542SQ95_9MICO|nr:biliverdin-producing heme oxygenase [Rarobacter incanus]TQK76783.1 heme oxygenase [Rarobacter incanus]
MHPTVPAPTLSMPLSAYLRASTRSAHETAENTGFITRLMGGELGIDAYADLAAQQYPIYAALEAASQAMLGNERGSALVFAELERTPAIRLDLAFLYGPQWEANLDILGQTREYVAAIEEIGDDVASYAAHAYTRYLGDLSGGQIIKRMMQRHYGMHEDGLAFYTFDQIPKAKPFKDIYRERLDGLDLSAAELDRAGAQAQRAFDLNTAMFAALGARH